MGHTNQTANYNLPQFVGTDKPSWLGDINDAFAAIDTAIAAAASEATTADGKADALTTTVSGHTTQIGVLQNTVTTQGNTLNTVTSLIGNGTPTTTDQTIIGAINELNAKEGNLSDLTTTDKSSLVAAINEAAAGGGGEEILANISVTAETFETIGNSLYTAIQASGKTVNDTARLIRDNGTEVVVYRLSVKGTSLVFIGNESTTSVLVTTRAELASGASHFGFFSGTTYSSMDTTVFTGTLKVVQN